MNGILSIIGDARAANNLSVDLLSNGSLFANANGNRLMMSPKGVKGIFIRGGTNVDSIYINAGIRIPAGITSNARSSLIKGGGGIDTIYTGNGNDVIYASGMISTGDGNDEVHAGLYSSYVKSGNGNDLLIGGMGNDTLISGTGYDTLIAGPGADVLQGGAHTIYQNVGPDDRIPAGAKAPGSQPSPPPPPAPTPVLPPAGAEDATIDGSNHGDPLAPVPAIQIHGASGPAAHSVFVNALSSKLAAGQPITARYQWNFGDPGSRFNVLPGWNAGHLYTRPGTYVITLTLTNAAGHTSTLSTQATVAADTRRAVYVDINGNDSNSGLSPSQAVRSDWRVNQLIADNTSVLFRRGETFRFGTGLVSDGSSIVFGAYGAGAAPVLMKVPGQGHGLIALGWESDQVVVENLTFDSVFVPVGNLADHIPATAVFPGGRNITVIGNTFLNIDDALDAYRGPTGLLVQDNSCPLTTGLRGYLEYIDGTDQVIVGNTVVNSTREHVIRSTDDTTQRILIAGNNFDNQSRWTVDPGDIPKTTINIRSGHYVYIADNLLSDNAVALGPGPWTPAFWSAENIVLEGNTLHNAQIYAASAVHHLMIRNNLLDIATVAQIELKPLDPSYPTRAMSDVIIQNNTGTLSSSVGTFLQLDGPSPAGVVTVKNNLFSAPYLQPGNGFSASVSIRAWDANAFASFSHNVWAAPAWTWRLFPGAVNFIAPILDYRQYRTADGWNTLPNVDDDQFRKVTVSPFNLQAPIDGQMAGAILPSPLG